MTIVLCVQTVHYLNFHQMSTWKLSICCQAGHARVKYRMFSMLKWYYSGYNTSQTKCPLYFIGPYWWFIGYAGCATLNPSSMIRTLPFVFQAHCWIGDLISHRCVNYNNRVSSTLTFLTTALLWVLGSWGIWEMLNLGNLHRRVYQSAHCYFIKLVD